MKIHQFKKRSIENLCDGKTVGDADANWKRVTCKRCLSKRPKSARESASRKGRRGSRP